MPSLRGRMRCTVAEIAVTVAYAEPQRQTVIAVRVPVGTTAAQAVALSAIRHVHPQIEKEPALGVFGQAVGATYVLRDGDRVELYRALLQDPKETRRRLAREGRVMGRATNK